MSLLSNDDANAKLQTLNKEWGIITGNSLERVYEFEDFKSALEFVNEVGAIAELKEHHPDIELSWGKVVIRVTTHSENGLTDKDFELAEEIDNA